jgi:hypothetical protein
MFNLIPSELSQSLRGTTYTLSSKGWEDFANLKVKVRIQNEVEVKGGRVRDIPTWLVEDVGRKGRKSYPS